MKRRKTKKAQKTFQRRFDKWAAENRRKTEQLKAELWQAVSELDRLEVIAQLALTYLMVPENASYNQREDTALWIPRLEFFIALMLQRQYRPEARTIIDGSELERISNLLEQYFMAFLWGEILTPHPEQPPSDSDTISTGQRLALYHVRGETYASRLYELAKELYSPHDEWMQRNLGFVITDVVAVCRAVAALIENKFADRLESSKDAEVSARKMYTRLVETPQNELDEDSRQAADTLQHFGLENAITAYCVFSIFGDSRLTISFSMEDLLLALEGIVPESHISAVLNRLSIEFGGVDLALQTPLDYNPLRERPIIRYGNLYFAPLIHLLPDVVFETFHFDLWRDRSYRTHYDTVRSE